MPALNISACCFQCIGICLCGKMDMLVWKSEDVMSKGSGWTKSDGLYQVNSSKLPRK